MDHQDSFWVERARRGDGHAFRLLVDKYRRQIEHLIVRSHRRDDASDLLQETLLQAYASLDELRDPGRFGAWLYGIALNVIKMQHRRDGRADTTSWEALRGGTAGPAIHRSADESPEDVATTRVLHAALKAAIDDLSEVNREAVVLHYIDGLSYREIATLLSVPLSTVKGRLHKARQQLRDELAPAMGPDIRKEFPAMIETTVNEVYAVERRDAEDHTVVVLKARDRERYLPIWIGEFEGTAIKVLLMGLDLPRPLTYQLVAGMLRAADARIEAVHITELRGETYIGAVQLRTNGQLHAADARPSDGLALALQVGAPIFVHPDVWAAAGVDSPTDVCRPDRTDVEATRIRPLELPEPSLRIQRGDEPDV